MATEEMFLSFHGLMLPKETHDFESLTFAHDFTFKDNDVLAVTYPKSGQFAFRLKHVTTCCNGKISSKHCDALFPLAKSFPWNRCLDVISCFSPVEFIPAMIYIWGILDYK